MNDQNVVGASEELVEQFQKMDHVKIGKLFKQNGGEWIQWKRKLPLASNMGGVWEHVNKNSAKYFQLIVEDTWCQPINLCRPC